MKPLCVEKIGGGANVQAMVKIALRGYKAKSLYQGASAEETIFGSLVIRTESRCHSWSIQAADGIPMLALRLVYGRVEHVHYRHDK